MTKYVAKRLLYMIPVLLGVAFLVFSILSMTPGDPGSIILGITASKEDIAALNAEFGYDKPFLIRFFRYIGDTSAISDGLQGFPAGSPMMTGLVATKKYLFWRISRHEFETFE